MNEPELRFKADDGSEYPEWKEKTLGDVCSSFEYGMNTAATKYDGENKYLRITDIDDDTHKYSENDIVSPSGELDSKYLVQENDIFFARTGASVGKTYIYDLKDGKLYFAGFLIRGKVKPEFNAYYVFLQTLTNKYKDWVKIMSVRSGQPGINANEYASYKFMCASDYHEQQKIADLFSALDNVINSVQKEVDSWEQMKRGMMQKLFSQEVRFKADDGGEFPEWEERNLSDVCNIVGGGTPSTDHNEYWDGDIQWFTPTEIGHSKYVTNSKRTITDIGLFKSSAKLLPVGTILLTTRATLGEMSIAEKQCCTNQGFQSLIVKSSTNRDYIYYLQGIIKNYCVKHAAGSTFREISGKNLGKCHIPYPCFEEQQKIADCLSKFDTVIEKTKQKLEAYKQLKKGLMQRMFV